MRFCNQITPAAFCASDRRQTIQQIVDKLCQSECDWTRIRTVVSGSEPPFDAEWADCDVPCGAGVVVLDTRPILYLYDCNTQSWHMMAKPGEKQIVNTQHFESNTSFQTNSSTFVSVPDGTFTYTLQREDTVLLIFYSLDLIVLNNDSPDECSPNGHIYLLAEHPLLGMVNGTSVAYKTLNNAVTAVDGTNSITGHTVVVTFFEEILPVGAGGDVGGANGYFDIVPYVKIDGSCSPMPYIYVDKYNAKVIEFIP